MSRTHLTLPNHVGPATLGRSQLKAAIHPRISAARPPMAGHRRGASVVVGAAIDLKPPPYALDALEPHMSKETLGFHWGKHHQTYVDNLNKLISNNAELEALTVGQIADRAKEMKNGPLFNNAGQVWNHDFFWQCMSPNGGESARPNGNGLHEAITRDFGSVAELEEKFKAAAAPGPAFGSGWVWLVLKPDGKLTIEFSKNAEGPWVHPETGTPLLTCDVWEHAYYLDHQNARPKYLDTFLKHLVDWEAAGRRYDTMIKNLK